MRTLAILTILLAQPIPAAVSEDTFTGVQRIVAVGDVHGGFTEFVAVLRAAGVIDKKDKWIGGATHLVQTGDCVDRGPDSRKVLDLLMTLETQARRAKGRVHALIGNHEAMNIYGDLRYVSPAEYASYKTGESAGLRDQAYELMADPNKKNDPAYKKQWYDEHPPGWVEHRQAFAAEGKYGKWIREHNAVEKINDYLFLHGGISQKYVSMPLAVLNQTIREELMDFTKVEKGVAIDPEGPLWYRGLATDPEDTLAEFAGAVLSSYGVKHVVLGHTPTAGAVAPRLGGKVFLIDVGLSKIYNDAPACLIVEGGKPFALHRGTKIELPVGSDPGPYFKQAAGLDPPGSALRKYVEGPR